MKFYSKKKMNAIQEKRNEKLFAFIALLFSIFLLILLAIDDITYMFW
jgi:hypothetical protein